MSEIEKALVREQYALAEYKKLYKIKGVDYDAVLKTGGKNYITAKWSAKDYLGDIVYWHESFARNIADVANSVESNPIRLSLRDATMEGVQISRELSIPALLRRLNKAQRTIEKHIFNNKIKVIPYKKNSPMYDRARYLDIRTSEFQWHFWAVAESLFNKK